MALSMILSSVLALRCFPGFLSLLGPVKKCPYLGLEFPET